MKLRTIKYVLKEGILNVYRNKLMSLASIGIVTASLIIFGIFLLITMNLNYNTRVLKEQPQVKVNCHPELDDVQIEQVEEAIKANSNVAEYRKVSKKEAFEEAKKILGEDEKVLEGVDEEFLPVSFNIKLTNPKDSISSVEEFKKIDGVENVTYSQKVIEFISKVTYWIRLICGFLITILLIIAMFIIANTIKLTVFARRREINIVKYIGATDWFIRLPFIVEGIIIGVIGAVAAFILIGYGYGTLETRINRDLLHIGSDILKFVKMGDIGVQFIGAYIAVGSFIGTIGSLISIRKYLRV